MMFLLMAGIFFSHFLHPPTTNFKAGLEESFLVLFNFSISFIMIFLSLNSSQNDAGVYYVIYMCALIVFESLIAFYLERIRCLSFLSSSWKSSKSALRLNKYAYTMILLIESCEFYSYKDYLQLEFNQLVTLHETCEFTDTIKPLVETLLTYRNDH